MKIALLIIVAIVLFYGCSSAPRYEQNYQDSYTAQPKPKSADDYYQEAVVYIDRGSYASAIQKLDNAISINPYEFSYYDRRGDAKVARSQCDEAIKDYTKAIELSPKVYTYHSRGKCYISTKQMSYAKYDAKKACEMGDCRLMQYFKNKK